MPKHDEWNIFTIFHLILGILACILAVILISFLTVCTVNYLMKDTAAERDLKHYRKYFDILRKEEEENGDFINNQ